MDQLSLEAKKKLVSIVVPVFNETGNLENLYKKIKEVFQFLDYRFEIIFINDGSQDDSFLVLKKLSQEDNRVKVLNFSRNFGKELATSAGCHFSKGDCVITMDADLQHPPELIKNLLEKWEQGFGVVFTIRKENQGASWFKKFSSKMYYWLINKIADVKFEPNSTDFRLMDRKVVNVFNDLTEKLRFFRGMIDWLGFKRDKIEFIAPERIEGSASYSYKKLFGLAVNSITSFSLLPLRLTGYLGLVITFCSTVLLFVMLYVRWFVNKTFFSSMAIFTVGNTILMGIVLCSLGFIALYIANINREVTNRPLYVVSDKINFEDKSES